MQGDVPNISMPLLGYGLNFLFVYVLEISTTICSVIAMEGKKEV